jgi:hypothetical protein
VLVGLAVAIAILGLLPAATEAAPITYIYSGVGSGSLDGVSFTDLEFVITGFADTDNISPWCCSEAQNTHSSTTVWLSGFGTFSFVNAAHTWMAEGCCMGLGADLGFNYLTLGAAGLVNVGYGLDTAFGPVTDPNATTQGQFEDIATTGGALTIESVEFATFEARTGAVPEPSTYALLALGLAGIAARRRLAR